MKNKNQTKQRHEMFVFKKLLNNGMKHLFAPVFVITLLFFPLFAFASALEKSKIVHIVTEFSDAKAGGL